MKMNKNVWEILADPAKTSLKRIQQENKEKLIKKKKNKWRKKKKLKKEASLSCNLKEAKVSTSLKMTKK